MHEFIRINVKQKADFWREQQNHTSHDVDFNRRRRSEATRSHSIRLVALFIPTGHAALRSSGETGLQTKRCFTVCFSLEKTASRRPEGSAGLKAN